MGKIIKSIFGGTEKPKVNTSSQESAEGSQRKANKSRSAIFATEGGVSGEELDPNSVKQRNTLLGN